MSKNYTSYEIINNNNNLYLVLITVNRDTKCPKTLI